MSDQPPTSTRFDTLGLDASLLGMSYLGRLSSFQATRQALFLRP